MGRTHDAIVREGMLQGYSGLIRYPYGREGGLMKLVARVTEGRDGQAPFDGAIYLIDPVDPSSIFPEALALKRQCITHGRPFISTLAGAIEWMEVERVHAGLTPDASLSRMFDYEGQTLALIAHDALKDEMVAFASEHFDVLSRFARRVATGTTGGRLNDLAWSRGWPKDKPWVHRYLSGPLGGDAQIAELVLEHQCQRVIFFEDPTWRASTRRISSCWSARCAWSRSPRPARPRRRWRALGAGGGKARSLRPQGGSAAGSGAGLRRSKVSRLRRRASARIGRGCGAMRRVHSAAGHQWPGHLVQRKEDAMMQAVSFARICAGGWRGLVERESGSQGGRQGVFCRTGRGHGG